MGERDVVTNIRSRPRYVSSEIMEKFVPYSHIVEVTHACEYTPFHYPVNGQKNYYSSSYVRSLDNLGYILPIICILNLQKLDNMMFHMSPC